MELTRGSCLPQSSGFWGGRPTAGRLRCRIWRRQRSRAAARYPAWAGCPAAGSPGCAYLTEETRTRSTQQDSSAHIQYVLYVLLWIRCELTTQPLLLHFFSELIEYFILYAGRYEHQSKSHSHCLGRAIMTHLQGAIQFYWNSHNYDKR